MYQVTNDRGITFNCVMGSYANTPTIRIYDSQYMHHPPYGQFVADYFIDKFLAINSAVCLHGDIDKWQFTAENVRDVQAYIQREFVLSGDYDDNGTV